MEARQVNQLTPNTHSIRMYGQFSLTNDADFALFSSIRANGILDPIVINNKNVIVSGVRRFMVAKMMLALKEVPVRVIDLNEVSELDVIEYNLQRIKNEVQWSYELEVIREKLGSKQGVKLNAEGKKKLDMIKTEVKKNVSDSTRKRVISAVKIQKELNPDKDEKEIWSELSKEVEAGGRVNSILKGLEAKKAKLINAERSKDYDSFEHELFKIIQGDALNASNQIEDNLISCLMTSPPYWDYRIYDANEKKTRKIPLGNEPTVDGYIDALVEIFRSYKSKMKSTSSIFINVMDKIHQGQVAEIPSKLSKRMQEEGFKYIQPIMWFKRNPQYLTNPRMAQPSCEYILHFTLSVEEYYWDKYWPEQLESRNLIHEALYGKKGEVPLIKNLIIPPTNEFINGQFVCPPLISTQAINKHSLNQLLESKGFQLTHSALYAYEIPMLFLLPTTQKGDVCLDVFSGLATTGIVAYATDRSYIGVENSKIYAAQSKARFIELFKTKNPEDFI